MTDPPADTGPDDALATFGRVSALLELGRPQEAASELSRALARSPEDPAFWRLMSTVRSDLGEYPEALEAARRAVALAPDESRSHVVLGVALWNAQVVGRRLTRVFPHAPKSGVLAVTAPVLAALGEALRLDPHNAEAHVHLANFLSWLHKRAEARRHYEAALQADPGNQDARLGLAALSLARRKAAEAERQVRGVLSEDPASVQAMGLLAQTQLKRRQGKAALDTALAAVRLDPANAQAQAQFKKLVNQYLPPPAGESLMIDMVAVSLRNRWRLARLSPEMRAQVRAVHQQRPRSVFSSPGVRVALALLVVAYVSLPIMLPQDTSRRFDLLLKGLFGLGLLGIMGWAVWSARRKR